MGWALYIASKDSANYIATARVVKSWGGGGFIEFVYTDERYR